MFILKESSSVTNLIKYMCVYLIGCGRGGEGIIMNEFIIKIYRQLNRDLESFFCCRWNSTITYVNTFLISGRKILILFKHSLATSSAFHSSHAHTFLNSLSRRLTFKNLNKYRKSIHSNEQYFITRLPCFFSLFSLFLLRHPNSAFDSLWRTCNTCFSLYFVTCYNRYPVSGNTGALSKAIPLDIHFHRAIVSW